MMRAEVIAIGDELTSGQRLDTNSQWLSAELGVLGVPVVFHTTAADTLEAGVEAFRAAADRADLVVATGGLGPTADDLTRDVLAAVAGSPLELSPEALTAVESRFARRGMPMPESNRRQAVFPRGSRIIPNPEGTAPGIDLDVAGGRTRIFALPGVPAEMRTMWRDTVMPAILGMLPERATIVQRRIKCFGAGESAIEAMLPDLVRRGRDPLVGITAHEATITLRIAARGRDEAECQGKIADTEATIRNCLGPLVYGVEDDELEDAVVAAVAAAGMTLATAEVGTDGRVAALLAQAAARSPQGGCFRGGRVLPRSADAGLADALAARARAEHDAAVGLGIGPVEPMADGRGEIEVALVTDAGVERFRHMLGGGAFLAGSRAAKFAIDQVRRWALARG
ncbi:MAG: CinA family nicotinamide mononucleotide deamidase-related protein [Planctomycetaceae bacterium]|nr:CinA family nicotinamide mononucleotide deamidase-related protein [Planctomycetaceae bacterium]